MTMGIDLTIKKEKKRVSKTAFIFVNNIYYWFC